MYRGAIANEKNDLQLARTKDPSITDRHANRQETRSSTQASEQV
ncbi:hypothetical protein RE6C_00344 [Rhodopirellula europaea 6C]|uniref:Uncharacterized protein n=1 Tax=Rhodopirellula europaea 6C TaxID=1263867 RepID=M2BB94_9BACT|nr:hypothetical protein RE6C_00344 [Rhodopirellula europaea 6C]